MSDIPYEAALRLIADLAPASRFYWIDRSGRSRERMTAADLARAVLNGQVDLSQVSQDRRDTER